MKKTPAITSTRDKTADAIVQNIRG